MLRNMQPKKLRTKDKMVTIDQKNLSYDFILC